LSAWIGSPAIRRLALAAGWLLIGAIVVMTLGPVRLRPQYGHPQLERFAAYLALGSAFAAAYPRRRAWVTVGLSAVAVGLEIGQNFIPGRDAGVPDAIAKVLGVAAGVLVVRLLAGPALKV
jgi:VanZ family protein